MRKRIFRFCIALAIAFTCCIGCQNKVSAADAVGTETPEDQFTYRYSSAYQGIELTKYLGKDTVVHIPSEIGGVPVTAVGEKCFYKTGMTDLTMPDTVTSVGKEAFAYCNALGNITWSENLKSIGESAFMGCGIQSFYMPDSLTAIGAGAFQECNALEEVVCSKGLTELNGTFFACYNLKTVRFPAAAQIARIGNNTFEGCPLKKFHLPASVVEIGESAFKGSLERITFPKDSRLERIGDYAFEGCGFWKVILPASLKEIGRYPFENCEELEQISFAKNARIERLPDGCFGSCYLLREVDIPENVTDIGANLFMDRKKKYYTKVNEIHIKGGKIKRIAPTAWKGFVKKGTITVPKKYKKKYTEMFQKRKWYKKTMKIKAVKKI